jgi:hypothetical protein
MWGLQRDWCMNHTLLALFCTVCVKHVLVVGRWAWAMAKTGATDGIRSLTRWVVMSTDPRGRVQRSILGSLSPLKIIFLLYPTVHLFLSNVMSQPTHVNTHIPNRDAIDKSGIMCPVRTNVRPSMFMLLMCVDMTYHPLANVTLSGRVVRRLLITSAPSMTKIWVAPEPAMVAAMFSQNIALMQNYLFCIRADKACALYEPTT